MKIANVIVSVLLGLAAVPALAQQAGSPAKGAQGDMSYEDYVIQRAKILLRMKGASAQPGQQPPGQEGAANGGRTRDSIYGQGYASRKNAQGAAERKPKIEHGKPERPERPRVERPRRP